MISDSHSTDTPPRHAGGRPRLAVPLNVISDGRKLGMSFAAIAASLRATGLLVSLWTIRLRFLEAIEPTTERGRLAVNLYRATGLPLKRWRRYIARRQRIEASDADRQRHQTDDPPTSAPASAPRTAAGGKGERRPSAAATETTTTANT